MFRNRKSRRAGHPRPVRFGFGPMVEAFEKRELLTTVAPFIQGTAFIDPVGNGILTTTDAPLANATISLYKGTSVASANFVSSTTTGTDGGYLFNSGLTVGSTYTLVESATGYSNTGAQANSQVDPASVIAPNTIQVTVVDPNSVTASFTSPVSYGSPPYDRITFTQNGVAESAVPTQLTFTLSGATNVNTTSYSALCVGINDRLSFTTPYPTVLDSQTALSGGVGGEIGYLYNHYGVTTPTASTVPASLQAISTKNLVAGVQVAIWELEYGSSLVLTGYDANYTSAQDYADLKTAAAGFLNDASGKSEKVGILDASLTGALPTPSATGGGQSVLYSESLNFGNAPILNAKLSGFVFADVNNNPSNPNLPGDIPLSGVTVSLNGTSSTGSAVSLTTTTNASGAYSFTSLPPSNSAGYTVTEGSTPGYTHEGQAAGSTGGVVTSLSSTRVITAIPLAPGANSVNNDFAEVGTLISGTVYVDATGNGLTTANQPPAGSGDTPEAGVTVNLTSSLGVIIATTTTATNGTFSFSEPVGTYGITESVPSGQIQTGPNALNYSVTTSVASPNSTNNNFSNYMACNATGLSGISYVVTTPAGVSTTVTNLRGNTAAGDTVTVNFTIAAGTSPMMLSLVAYEAPTSYYTTSNASQQVLTSVATGTFGPGAHSLTVTEPNSFFQVDFICGAPLTQLLANGSSLTYSYENRLISADNGGTQTYATSTLSGTVYVDNNGTNSFSTGDTGLGGITLTLSGTTSTGVAIPAGSITATTASSGTYSFAGLAPGNYTVTETQPAGYTTETANPGSIGGTAGVGVISSVALNSNTTATSYNFGEYQATSLSGTIYIDNNGNDKLDSGDVGQGNITVYLYNGAGTVQLATTTTASNGTYSFKNLAPGTYIVGEVVSSGYTGETPNTGSTGGTGTYYASNMIEVLSSIPLVSNANSTGNNFGQYKPGTYSGTVYNDANGNDKLDSGDTGLPGITVTLSSGTFSATTTTDANGNYSFSGIVPGLYQIAETVPAGYVAEAGNVGTAGGNSRIGIIDWLSVTSGTSGTGYNFPQYQPSSISGTVYVDATGSGLTTANQPPVGSGDTPEAGVTVNLYNASGVFVASTVTAANGTFSFSEPVGTYGITESVPSGQIQTGPNALNYVVTTSVASPNSTNNNFSNYMACNAAGLSNIQYYVNGKQVSDLRGNGYQGATVTVTFTVAANASPIMLSLVAYEAPASYYTSSNASQQVITSYQTGTYGPGVHTLKVTLPNSYYQVDFVCGAPLSQLEANGSHVDYNYENRLISADNGGTNCPPSYCPLPLSVGQGDIGNVGTPGTESYNNGTYTLTGSGSDIWNQSDAFNYAYQTLNGDGEIITRVTSIANTDSWAKAGVMIRQSLDPGSAQASVFATPGNGVVFQDRETQGGNSNSWSANNSYGCNSSTPVYVKLVRSGSTLSGYDSTNGVTWTYIGSDTINMSQQVYVGLAVTSHNNSVATTATFDSVNTKGYWGGCSGQSLIQSCNGSTGSTSLSSWLAQSYPNLYGSSAGCDNLWGQNNNGVASFCLSLEAQYGPDSLECQTLSAALTEYFSSWQWGGQSSYNYGFNVSWSGFCSTTVSVSCGDSSAFNGSTSMSVSQMLQAENNQACSGILYAGNASRHKLACDAVYQVSSCGY